MSDECEFDDARILEAIEELKRMLINVDYAIQQLRQDLEYVKRHVT